MKNKITLIAVFVVFIFSGCVKIGEYYIGLNLQPDIDKADFEHGLNVYGILKTGPSLDTLNHYFEVQNLLYVNGFYDSLDVKNAQISLKRITAKGDIFNYQPLSTADGFYFDTTIQTAPGDQWFYTCHYDTIEILAKCIVPEKPQTVGEPLFSNDAGIRFTLKEDTTAYMYDIYLINGKNFFKEKRVPQKGINTTFTLRPEWPVEEGINQVYVFAYDQNLEKYFTTSNMFFKPNAFRPGFTTVDGGFGTFGAVSSNLFVVK